MQSTKILRLGVLIVIVMVMMLDLQSCGQATVRLEGMVYDIRIRSGISQANLRFIEPDFNIIYSETTDTTGAYSLSMVPGCYWIHVMHKDYEDYSSIPSCVEVNNTDKNIEDFPLRPPIKTTVLLVRHAERSDDDLTSDGIERRDKLAKDLLKAGVTAIYSTETTRTEKTVQGLASLIRIRVTQQDDITVLADSIKREHEGDTILVAGHSGNYVPTLVRSLMDEPAFYVYQCTGNVSVTEYDNLFIITKSSAYVHLLNLQYGVPTDGGITNNDVKCEDNDGREYPETVLFLAVVPDDPANFDERSNDLAHALQKVRLASTWIPENDEQSREFAENLPQIDIHTYPRGYIGPWYLYEGKINLLLTRQSYLAYILEQLQIDPLPILDPREFDNLFVFIPTFKPTLLNLQYGSPSP